MPDQPACTVTGYQEVCLDADILITATATPGTPVVTCVTTPTINPYGANTCPTGTAACGFTAQVTLCVAVPVSFGAEATTTAVRQQCGPANNTACAPIA